jgi:cytidylate kinase
LFVTASAEVRGKRRFDELAAREEHADLIQVIEGVRARDARDMERAEAPLRPAEDSIQIDTSDLNIEEAVAVAIAAVTEKIVH